MGRPADAGNHGPAPWRTAANRPLEPLGPDLWQIEADLPRLPLGRRMVVARRGDGSLVVHNAVCADGPTMTAIEALGPIRWLVVPGAHHRMDLAAWNARYPQCTVVAMAAVTPRLRECGRIDGGPELLPDDPALTYAPLDGVPGEGVLVHRVAGRTTLVFNDVVQNNGRLRGVIGAVLALVGSGGGPKVTRIAQLAMVGDRRAFAAHLERLATDVAMIIPGHGAVIRERAPEALRAIASAL
jgi:hypothetical protein